MRELINFTDKKIVVLGASSGIGKETAIALSSLGAQIIIVARRKEKLEETLTLLEGNGHAYYATDISIPENIEEFAVSLRDLLNNPSKIAELGKNGRRAIKEQFNWELEQKNLLDLYERLSKPHF